MIPKRAPTVAICCAVLSTLAATLWMTAVAHFDYGGNWTAFYRTGADTRLPPIAAEEKIYLLHGPGSGGYDGQFYRLIAQDPLILHGTVGSIDSPRLRYRRILVPALAWLAGLGRPKTITYSYIAVVILFLGLGTYWLSRYAALIGVSPWWGSLFVLTPAAFLSLDRLTVDIALAAFTVSFALYWKDGSQGKLYLVFVLAPLAKETGMLLLAGYALHNMIEGQWRRALWMSTSAIPAAFWFLYVQRHTPDYGTAWIQLPFSAVLEGMLHPELYPLRPWYVTPFDYLAWFGLILAILLGILWCRERTPLAYAAAAFGVLAAVIDFNVWQEVEGFGRAFTPLLILLPVIRLNWWSWTPLLLMVPRALVFPLSESLRIPGT